MNGLLKLFLCLLFCSRLSAFDLPPFEAHQFIADATVLESAKNTQFLGVSGIQSLSFFKQLYQQAQFFVPLIPRRLKIPKKIHQIWLGSELPPKFKKFQQSWQRVHPDWEYKLWSEKDIATVQLSNQKLYDRAKNYGEKSDIARYEILALFGGLYVDVDTQCLKPFDELHMIFDFYAGLNPFFKKEYCCATNSVIGAVPGHPILRRAIDLLATENNRPWPIPERTGPGLFTRACLQVAGKTNCFDILFPSSYFSPVAGCYHEPWSKHYWAHSWLVPQANLRS